MTANRKLIKSISWRKTSGYALLLALFIGELLFYTWCRVQCVRVGIAIGQENRKVEAMESLQNSLQIELARLKAPERIAHIARNELQLEMPDPRQVVVLP